MNLQDSFEALKVPQFNTSDICEHLDTLKDLAAECDHVTELGFRTGTSFCAFLMGQPKKLVTYDVVIPESSKKRLTELRGNTFVEFHQANTLEVEIEETDLLFIDTLHTYSQLKRELFMHGNKARKYLAFHDIETFGKKSEDGTVPGLQMAVIEFVEENPHWQMYMHLKNNNGILVLKRHN